MTQATLKHKSVLVQEVLENINLRPKGQYLDATFGGGGHTRAILQAQEDCQVFALDWDKDSLELASQAFAADVEQGRLKLAWGSFVHAYRIFKKNRWPQVDGVLADFGTSQHQIFSKDGMSFAAHSYLDMRMSKAHSKITAAEVLNTFDHNQLAEIFWNYGEERFARLIAKKIVSEREIQPITMANQLAELVKNTIVPHLPRAKTFSIHPATKVFQALRIFVNDELENIKLFLPGAMAITKKGGHLVFISFHSLEDRIVKDFFKEQAELGKLKIITRKPIVASEEEVGLNQASRSALMRIATIL